MKEGVVIVFATDGFPPWQTNQNGIPSLLFRATHVFLCWVAFFLCVCVCVCASFAPCLFEGAKTEASRVNTTENSGSLLQQQQPPPCPLSSCSLVYGKRSRHRFLLVERCVRASPRINRLRLYCNEPRRLLGTNISANP
mmetsp:Transcript_75774/g.153726  ORF Transcript_75774/g.153726 Transcript_75774/m.153726 type:complete len:139 (+) Transcript_75774:154-570(+)